MQLRLLLSHRKPLIWLTLLAGVVGAAPGCWEEVHYTGPSTPTRALPVAENSDGAKDLGSNAEAFGDELEKKLAALDTKRLAPDQTAATRSDRPAASEPTPHPGGLADARSRAGELSGTRYQMPPATSATPQPEGVSSVMPETAATAPPIPNADNAAVVAASRGATGRTSADTASHSLNEASEPSGGPLPSPPVVANSTSAARTQQPAQLVPPARAATKLDSPAATRRAGWLLASRWSLAAPAHERGADDKSVDEWLDFAQMQASLLGVTLMPLPPRSATENGQAAQTSIVDYLVAERQRMASDLAVRHGPEGAALFELAVDSNLLLVLYQPGSREARSLSNAISKAREGAGLPPDVTRPLLAAISERSDTAAIRKAVFRLHDELDRRLGATSPQPAAPQK